MKTLREMMMTRIEAMLGPFTDSKYDQKFLSTRWAPVGRFLYFYKFHEDGDTKQAKAFLKTAKLDDFQLQFAEDGIIMDLFEMVTRRYYTQM